MSNWEIKNKALCYSRCADGLLSNLICLRLSLPMSYVVYRISDGAEL